MAELTLAQALERAKQAAASGKASKARAIYAAVLKAVPNHKVAKKALEQLGPEQAQGVNPSKADQEALIALFKKRQFTQAAAQAEAMTQSFPKSFFVWNLFAAAQASLGQTNKAAEGFRKTIELNPNYADGHSNLGGMLGKQGKLDEAVASYKRALEIQPDHAEVHYNLGNALQGQGKLDEAVAHYKRALEIKPDFGPALNNLGLALQEKGKLDDAVASCKRALEINPNYADGHSNLGDMLGKQGKLDEAVASYKRALEIKPDHAEVHYNLGNALQSQGKLDEAVAHYKRALEIKPDFGPALNNLGIALQEKGNLDEAVASCKRALEINPNYAEAHSNLGIVLKDLGKLDEAVASCKRALAIKPDHAEAYGNLGVALQELGKLDEAVASYKRALEIKPDYAEAHFNLGCAQLLLGDCRNGFANYEHRFLKKTRSTRQPDPSLEWDGELSLKGKKFFVYDEQGLGDTIMFCRYLRKLQKLGAYVTFQTPQKMHTLLSTLDFDITLTSANRKKNEYDFEAPLMSLPYLFQTNLRNIPKHQSYIRPARDRVQKWNKKLRSKNFKIGICWQGSEAKVDRGRSFHLSRYKEIASISNVELISLHKGAGEAQLRSIDFPVTTLGENFDEGPDAFQDSAAVIKNCDLVITSDTAIAHLAGALGCKTWVALQWIPDWRWFLNRSDSPWYPSMRLYRQISAGDWNSVFERLAHDVRKEI